MPGCNADSEMGDNNSYSSKELALERPQFRGISPLHDIGMFDKAYKTLPEHTNTPHEESRPSIIKAKFSNVDKKDKRQTGKESSPFTSKSMDQSKKSSTKSRFSICKSPIVTDETTGALIEFSTGTDISPSHPISQDDPDTYSAYHTISGAGYRSRYSPQRYFEPLKSERNAERRLRRVTETEEDLPSPIKSPTSQPPVMLKVEEEKSPVSSPTPSRFSVTKTSLGTALGSKDPSPSRSSGNQSRNPIIKASVSPSLQHKERVISKDMLAVPRKSLLKHSNSTEGQAGGSSCSSSCSSVASGKSLKTSNVVSLNDSSQDEFKRSTKSAKAARATNVKFGKEVTYLDGEPLGTPPPSRERSRSDAAATLTKLKNFTMRYKEPSKTSFLKEKHASSKQAKVADIPLDASNDTKPTHKRTNSCDTPSSQNISTDRKSIDKSLDKLPDKLRPRTRSEKLSKNPKTKVVLEDVSTKTSFDWPLGRLGKLRQKYTRKKSLSSSKLHQRRKSKGESYSAEKSAQLNQKSKSIEAISKAHHPVAASYKKPKEEADDLVYELPTHYQTVLPVIKSRVIRPVMGLFRQNSSKGKLKKNKRDRQRHPTDGDAVGSRKDVAEPEMRRRAASLSTPHRGSDVNVDPLHSAILFRDARGLPETDPFMEKMEKDEESSNYGKDGQIFVQFFHFHKCYDLIPTSAKLVVFDTELLVKKAFFALVYNGVRAAPLWDSTKQRFVGMLTITDFIRILQMYYKSPTVEMEELEEHQLQTWRSVLKKDDVKQLVSIDPEATLFDAIKTLIQNKIHRLPVIDPETGNVLYILTHKRLLRFLFLYIHDLPKPQYFNSSINDLKIGTYNDIEIAHHSTPIIEALNKFVKRRISALPIVDEEGRLIDIYAKFDVINLAAEKTYSNLDISLKKANEHRNEWFEGVHSCKHTDTLFSVMEKIVKAEVHRLVIVDENNRVMGVVSLSDILSYLVLRPLDENGNGTESTTCDDTTKEVKISDGTNSEAAMDENKDINTGSEISVTKQLVEEETVMNTAVED